MTRLPDFLVIGAYKSGTTALHYDLRRHPQVFVPKRKEPNFFAFEGLSATESAAAAKSIRTLEEYESLFTDANGARAVGEVSPEYLVNPRAVERIQARIPDARLVAVLRNPVDRAYSDYLMYRRDMLEPCERFADAIAAQEERQARGDPTGYYVTTGFYGTQLARYVDRFGRDAIHVVLHDDLRADRSSSLAGIFRFIGVDDAVAIENQPTANVSGEPTTWWARAALRVRRRVGPTISPLVPDRAKLWMDSIVQRRLRQPPMTAQDRSRLIDVYRDDIRRLEGLIDRDLSAWLAGG